MSSFEDDEDDYYSGASSSEDSIVEQQILNNDEQTLINYHFSLPSLQRISKIQLVACAWKMPQLEKHVREHHEAFYSERDCNYRYNDFCQIKKMLLNRLEQFLPPKLRNEVSSYVGPIGLQIFEWMSYIKKLCPDLYKSIPISNFIQWKMNGTVDKTRTFESLLTIKSEQNVKELYKMACYYCLEDYIDDLRGQLPTSNDVTRRHELENYKLELFWDDFPTKQKGENEVKEMLKLSIKLGNSAAMKFFWSKLTNDVKSEIVVKCAKQAMCGAKREKCIGKYEYTKMLVFFLSEMNNENQQRKVFEHFKEEIVELLYFHVPWQEFLLPTINVMWSLLGDYTYHTLIEIIARDINMNDLPNGVLKELWETTPIHLKRGFFECSTRFCGDALLQVCKMEDVEMMRMILKDASNEEKETIVFTIIEYVELPKILTEDKLHAFEMNLREVASHTKDFDNIKEKVIERHADALCHYLICSGKLQMVDKFLNWAFASKLELQHYKKHVLNKITIFRTLVSQGDYEKVEKFLYWCFSSVEEIAQFKKELMKTSGHIIVAYLDFSWYKFQTFVDWCCTSEEEKRELKSVLLAHDKVCNLLPPDTFKRSSRFVEKLLKWCFDSEAEIARYKRELMLSQDGVELFEKLADFVHIPKLSKLQIQWYGLLDKEFISEYKVVLQERLCRGLCSKDQLKCSFRFLNKLGLNSLKVPSSGGEGTSSASEILVEEADNKNLVPSSTQKGRKQDVDVELQEPDVKKLCLSPDS